MSIFYWLLFTYLGFILFKNIQLGLRLYHYHKQGIPVYWYPVFGCMWEIVRSTLTKEDHCKYIKQKLTIHKDKQLVCWTSDKRYVPMLVMNHPNTLRDFFQNEIGNVIKDRFAPELNLGFFFANGDDAFRQRKMFSNIFHYDNLTK
jgi:hypothetical protein